jgi:conjugative transfer region protein TrbK
MRAFVLRLRRAGARVRQNAGGVPLRLAAAALVFASILIGIHQSRRQDLVRRDEPSPKIAADALAVELARCRTASDQNAVDEICRRAWADNRRRFFSLPEGSPSALNNNPAPGVSGKEESRLRRMPPNREEVR